ncbi:hypothetical protein [Turicimonas muris]|uniref:hypothetical protein n=1 Tax=Turicimonas muris TaxID=1796652 RepID=UPI0026301BEF|nr:hypothetical protein [Turicimonas muris]
MRIIDFRSNKDLVDPDLNAGHLIKSTCIKKDAVPIDDVTKFAWDDDDYEPCFLYILKEDLPDLGDAPSPINEAENALCELYEENLFLKAELDMIKEKIGV